jgi:hypothetical protein
MELMGSKLLGTVKGRRNWNEIHLVATRRQVGYLELYRTCCAGIGRGLENWGR